MTITNTTIETVTGRLIDLAKITQADIDPIDIAWALSREPRFGGHTITELAYSVGQHSIRCAELVELIFSRKLNPVREAFHRQFENNDEMMEFWHAHDAAPNNIVLKALLHDASEAYLRDLPSPVKALPGLKEAYGREEARIMGVIYESFGLSNNGSDDPEWPIHCAIVHWVDIYARTIEAYHFMKSRGANWGNPQCVSLIDIQGFEMPRPAVEVFSHFMDYLEEITSTKYR
jgi:hypothetical protein